MGQCFSSSCADRREEAEDADRNGGFVCGGPWRKNTKREAGDGWRLPAGVEEVEEDALHRVPGRMFSNGASEVACLFTQEGRKGTNQDAMVAWENFSSKNDTIFCGVFDGHGPYGHMVATKVRDSLPLKLCKQWRRNDMESSSPRQNIRRSGSSMNSEKTAFMSFDDECDEYTDGDENEQLSEMYLRLKKSFRKAFKLMDMELKFHPMIDCFCSGTTAVAVVKQGQELVIGNVGDSRAVLGTLDNNNNLVALQLTVDLKPNLPREAARIQQCKGRVFALQDEPEVARVWLPNNDSPGLAMARAFGDFCLKDYGLISVPDISYHNLSERDKFIILATDGVWDVLSNEEVVDIVATAPSRRNAARALVECAVRAWRLKFPTSKSDDCAVVCLFLDCSSSSVQDLDISSKVAIPGEATTDVSLADPEMSCKSHDNGLIHLNDFDNDDEIVSIANETEQERVVGPCQSTRRLADCISSTEGEEWSALEGVTRVNSLLSIPRLLSRDKRSTVSLDKRLTSWRKWLQKNT